MDTFLYAVLPGMLLAGILLICAAGAFAFVRYLLLPKAQVAWKESRRIDCSNKFVSDVHNLMGDLYTDFKSGRAVAPASNEYLDRITQITQDCMELEDRPRRRAL